jgi:hypothetical protein
MTHGRPTRGAAVLGAVLFSLLLSLSASALALTVESPNGGERLRSGRTYKVQVSDAGAARLAIFFSLDGGAHWSLGAGTPLGSSFAWRVPVVSANKGDCLIEAVSYAASGRVISRDRSDAPFSIVLLELLTPTGGETFTPGEVRPIRWELNRPPLLDGYTSVEYTADGGATWQSLARFRGFHRRRYEWTVPDVVSDTCAVRVRLQGLTRRTVATSTGGAFSIGMLQLQPEAQAADPETAAALTGVERAADGSITLTFSADTSQLQALAPGVVLVFGSTPLTPHGLIGRVVSRAGGPGPVTVLLVTASVADVIREGTLSVNEELDPSTYVFHPEPDAGVLGTRVVETLEPGIAGTVTKEYEIKLEKTLRTGNAEIVLEGKLTLKLSTELSAEFDWRGISHLRLTLTPEQAFEVDLKLQGTVEGDLWDKEFKLGTIDIPDVWCYPWGIPTKLAFAVDVYVGVKGKVSTYVRTGVSQEASMTVGVEWDRAEDKTDFIHRASLSYGWTPVAMGVTGSLEGYAKLQAEMLVDGLVGPTLSFSKFLRVEGSADTSRCIDVQLSTGVKTGVGGKIEFFNREWGWEREFEPLSKVIWQKDFCDSGDYGKNLLQNADYESGSFTGWKASGGAKIDRWYRQSGRYGAWVYEGPGAASQEVNLSDYASAVDAGKGLLTAGGYCAGFADVCLKVELYYASGARSGRIDKCLSPGGRLDYLRFAYNKVSVPPYSRKAVLTFYVPTASSCADAGWDNTFLYLEKQ